MIAATTTAPPDHRAGFHEAASPHRDLQREQAEEAARERDREKRREQDARPSSPAPVIVYEDYVCRRLCHAVWEVGDEIRFRCHRGRPPSEKQIDAIVTKAVEKGWGVLYVYNGWGHPAPEMTALLQRAIAARGLHGRLHCCTEAEELGTLGHKKRELRAARYGCHDFQEAAAPQPVSAPSADAARVGENAPAIPDPRTVMAPPQPVAA